MTQIDEAMVDSVAAAIMEMAPLSDGRMAARNAIAAILTALHAQGYVIVPSEPTWLMEQAGEAALRKLTARPAIRDAYRAMLAARGE